MNRALLVLAPFVLFVAFSLPSFPCVADPAPAPRPRDPVRLTDEVLRIHRDAPVFDGHNDLPWHLRELEDLSLRKLDLRQPQKQTHTDIPRLRQGGVGAQFWSAFVPAESRHKGTAVKLTLEQIDLIRRLVQAYPDVFELALSADDVERIRKQGKIASLIGVEGGHSIDDSLGVLRMLHALGVRYMTLTHGDTLDWADSATDAPKSHGLSPFGEQVVREMNRLGMLVDISHVSAETMRAALRVSKAPVIASHSSAYAVAEHPRNVPDDVLRMVRDNGGVVMVNFFPGFVVPEGARATRDLLQVYRELQKKYPDKREFKAAMEQWRKEHPYPDGSVHHVVDHIEHIIRVAGIDHVGLGSDFDGIGRTPRQLEDVSCYPYITQELLNRGHRKEDVLKVLGGNILRVLRRAGEVARAEAGQP
jgi:membrane dipeptidase